MISSTITSGAEAPAVMPRLLDALETRPVDDRWRAAPAPRSGSPRARRPRAAAASSTSSARRPRSGRRPPAPPSSPRAGGWWWRSRCLPCAGPRCSGSAPSGSRRSAAVSSIDSVVWVTKARLSGSFGVKVVASSAVSISVTAPAGSWPSVPTTSGWCECPISRISRPRLKWIAASRCTLVTSGQVASSEKKLRGSGLGRNRFRNAMGRKHHRCVGIVGDFGEFLDENGALGPQAVDHIAVMDDFVPDIDRGAIDGERPFHGVDGAHHAGAEAPRRTKHDFEVWFGWRGAVMGAISGPNHPSPAGRERSFPGTNWDCFRPLSRHFSRPLRRRPRDGLYRPNSRHR